MQDHLPKIWEPIAAVIGLQVSRETFQRWFAGVELVAADEDS